MVYWLGFEAAIEPHPDIAVLADFGTGPLLFPGADAPSFLSLTEALEAAAATTPTRAVEMASAGPGAAAGGEPGAEAAARQRTGPLPGSGPPGPEPPGPDSEPSLDSGPEASAAVAHLDMDAAAGNTTAAEDAAAKVGDAAATTEDAGPPSPRPSAAEQSLEAAPRGESPTNSPMESLVLAQG